MATSIDRHYSLIPLAIMASLLFCQVTRIEAAATTSQIVWEAPAPRITAVGGGPRTVVGNALTVCKGDSVRFDWQMAHGVAQSKLAAWTACDISAGAYVEKAPISSPGTVTIRLPTAGVRYYYCQNPGHCAAGQKVKVVVLNRRC